MESKVILITGASNGIGAKVAIKLAKQGATVILTGRNEERLKKITNEAGDHASYYVMDVRDEEQVRQTVHHIIQVHKRIDILLNNAGYGIFAELNDMDMQQVEDMMDTNFLGLVRCTKAVLPFMKKEKSGHIINIASMAGKIGSAKSTIYTATKHAVLGFTNSLRMELQGSGIYVSAINPGPINTEFFQQADPSGQYVKNVSWFMMEADYVANQIMKVMKNKRAELDLPKLGAVGLKFYQLFPRWIDKVAGGLFNKK